MKLLKADTDPPLYLAEIDAGELPSLERDFIADIFASRLVGIVVRAAFPAPVVAQVVERLESGAYNHRQRDPKYWEGRVYGPHLQSTPDMRVYFEDVVGFRSACAALFEGGPDFQARIEELLAYARGGRPISVLRGPAGEPYAVATIRNLTSGEMQVHCDIEQTEHPAIRHIAAHCDVSTLLSYFVTLATPESGGEFYIHGLRSDQEPGRGLALMDPASHETRSAIDAYGELPVHLAPGDLIVFNAGHYFHHVTPVVGARTRWTQGGFLSRSCDGSSLFYWH